MDGGTFSVSQLANRYGIALMEAGVYVSLGKSRAQTEAACAARRRGVAHGAVRQALAQGATVDQIAALRPVAEPAPGASHG